jgi:hypothetical protein
MSTFLKPATEASVTMRKALDSLLAALLHGRVPTWLDPVETGGPSKLRLWRARDLGV